MKGGARAYVFVAVRGLSDVLDFVRGFLLISLLGGAFGPAVFGTWGLVEQTYSVAVILAGLGLSQSVVRYLAGPHSVAHVRRTAFVSASLIVVLGLLLTALLHFLSPQLADRIIRTEEARACLLAALPLVVLNALELFLDGCFRARLRINVHSLLRMAMTALTLLAYFYAARRHLAIEAIITLVLSVKGLYVLALLAVFAFLECIGKDCEETAAVPAAGDFDLPGDGEALATMKGMLAFGAPLMMFGLATWLFSTGGKLVLGFQAGAGDVGRFDASLKIAMLVQYLGLPVVYTLLPLLADAVRRPGGDVPGLCRRFSRLYFFLALPLLFGLLATYGGILDLMTGRQEFLCPAPLFLVLLLGNFLGQLNAFYHNVVFLKGDSRYIFLANLGVALLCLLLNALFTRPFGMWCTAFSSLLSYALLMYLLARKTASYGIAPGSLLDLGYALKCALAAGLMFLAVLGARHLPLQGPGLLAALGAIGALAYALATLLLWGFSPRRALKALGGGAEQS